FAEALDSWYVEQSIPRRHAFAQDHPHAAALLPDQPLAQPERFDHRRLARDLLHFLTEVSPQGPVIVVLEDLQDADPESLQVLHLLTRSVIGTRIRLLVTVREDHRPELSGPLLPEAEGDGASAP